VQTRFAKPLKAEKNQPCWAQEYSSTHMMFEAYKFCYMHASEFRIIAIYFREN